MTKKRVIAFISVLVIVATIMTIGASAALPTGYRYRVLFNSTVRSGAGTDYSSLGIAGIGSSQQGVNSSSSYVYNDYAFTKIHWNSGYGYIRNDLLCPDVLVYRVNVSTNARIRVEPEDPSYVTVPDDTVLQLLSDVTQPDSSTNYVWYNVLVRTGDEEGYRGWIRSDLVTIGY